MKIPTPAIVSSHAVRRLPKWSLYILCFLYVMAGSVGRDPWKSMDIASLGYMLSLSEGSSTLFNLQLAGIPPELDAFIPYWLGAFFIKFFPWVKADVAARIPFIFSALLGMVCLWQAIYFLARNPQAQPVAFAFGGEANPKDYARSLADAGLLGYLACLGLAVPSHEMTPMAFQLQIISLIFLGSAVMPFFLIRGIIAWSSGLFLLTYSGAPTLSTIIGLGTLFIWSKHPQSTNKQIILLSIVCSLLVILANEHDLWHWRLLSLSTLSLEWKATFELLVWFLWPAWPLAMWTIWRWRGHWSNQIWSQHLVLPVFLFLTTLLASVFTENADRTLLLTLPSLAALAAFALPTFSRAAAAIVDWFTLLFFSVGALILWIVWISLETGTPQQPALNVYGLIPGYKHQFNLIAFSIAITATLLWIKLIHWRIGKHPAAIWKSMVLPASGAIVCWIILMTLWLPFLDRGLSYKSWAEQLIELTGKTECIYFYELDRNQIAGLAYHGKITFLPYNLPSNTCKWLLVKESARYKFAGINENNHWIFKQKFQKPGDKKDLLQIYYLRIENSGE